MVIVETSIFNWKSAVKGFLAGSLIILGLFTNFNVFARLIIFIIGFLMLVDSFLPFGEQPYIVIAVLGAIIGAIITFASILTKFTIYYLIIVLIIAVLFYFSRIYKRFRRK